MVWVIRYRTRIIGENKLIEIIIIVILVLIGIGIDYYFRPSCQNCKYTFSIDSQRCEDCITNNLKHWKEKD